LEEFNTVEMNGGAGAAAAALNGERIQQFLSSELALKDIFFHMPSSIMYSRI